MAQNDLIISNQSFPSFRSDLNSALQAIQTTHSGTSAPPNIQTGQIWLDITNSSQPTLKYYDGADNISLATLDHSANTVNWLDSTVSITGLSTTATGTVLTLSDTNLNSTVSIRIPTTKGIDDDSGNEFLKFTKTATAVNEFTIINSATGSAPEIQSTGDDTDIDLKITPKGDGKIILDGLAFPNADGSASQVLQTNGSGVLSFATPSSGANTPAFAAKNTGTQSIANDADVELVFDTVVWDTDSAYSTVNNRFTVPAGKGGKYFFHAHAQVPGIDDTELGQLSFWINGSPDLLTYVRNNSSGTDQIYRMSMVHTVSLNATDYVEVYFYQNSGDSQNGTNLYFSGYRLIGV